MFKLVSISTICVKNDRVVTVLFSIVIDSVVCFDALVCAHERCFLVYGGSLRSTLLCAGGLNGRPRL